MSYRGQVTEILSQDRLNYHDMSLPIIDITTRNFKNEHPLTETSSFTELLFPYAKLNILSFLLILVTFPIASNSVSSAIQTPKDGLNLVESLLESLVR